MTTIQRILFVGLLVFLAYAIGSHSPALAQDQATPGPAVKTAEESGGTVEREQAASARLLAGILQLVLSTSVSAIIGFLSALLLWQVKKVKLDLEYELIFLDSDNQESRQLVIPIRNAGKAAVENIQYTVSLPQGKIDSSRFSEPAFVGETNQVHGRLETSIRLLNPGEELVHTLTIKELPPFTEPRILLRAVGVTGHERARRNVPAQRIFQTRGETSVRILQWVAGALLILCLLLGLWSLKLAQDLRTTPSVEVLPVSNGVR